MLFRPNIGLMSFIRKTVDTQRGFGSEMRELRDLRGWTVEQLSKATGIHASIINALEGERLDEFKDHLYVERHIKSIVTCLDGRIGFILGKYRDYLKDQGTLENAQPLTFYARMKRTALFVPSKYLLFFLPLPLVIILGWYVWHQAVYLSAAPDLRVITPVDHQVLSEPMVTVTGITDSSANVTVNGMQAIIENSGAFNLTLYIPRGMTKLDIVARRRYGGASQAVRYVTYAPEYAPAVLNPNAFEASPATSTEMTTSTEL